MGEFPNRATQFKVGNSGNPAGKTKAQRQAEVDAAEIASFVSLELVKAVQDTLLGADTETKREQIKGDVLTLLRNVQDRAYGSPKQSVDNTSSDGSMTPAAGMPDAVLEALRRKHAEPSTDSPNDQEGD